jgi:hypothetical protein
LPSSVEARLNDLAVGGAAAVSVVERGLDGATGRGLLVDCDAPQPINPAASIASQMASLIRALADISLPRVDGRPCRNLEIG